MIEKGTAKPGDRLNPINVEPLKGKTVAPPLKLGEPVILKEIFIDGGGNEHFDVGLRSNYNYITSQETGEELPKGNHEDSSVIHWCHPSRFEPAN